MKQLKLSRDLALPLDVAGEAIAILAKRGAGKTNTATVLVEELYAADVQTVILDPVGAWWGLRSGADGESEGLKIARLGGQHGDVPLEQTAGALIADVAVDSGKSLVVDLSDFPSKGSVQRFVTDFAERLYRRKSRDQSLLHLVLEEADEFAPQGQRNDTARMRGAIEQIVRRGRSRGLGVTLITQRSAVLNKDVLTQADVLIVMRTTGPHDVDAIKQWVAARGDEKGREVIDSLPSLQTGEAWVWNPEHDILKRTKVRARKTFDSSQTPKAGQRRAEPRKVAEIDPAQLGKQIAETAEQAKANDPRELRKQVAALKRELEQRPAEIETKVETITERVEVPVLTQLEERRLTEAVIGLRAIADQIEAALGSAKAHAAEVKTERKPTAKPTTPARPPARRPAAVSAPVERDGALSVSGPQQRILNALAALEAIGVPVADKTQLALFAQASPKSSAFSNNLGYLNNQAGLIHYPRPGAVALTDAGRELADAADAPSTVDELRAYVFRLVGGSKSRILEVLIAEGGDPVEKDELAARAGASPTSSAFSNNLGSLRSLGLIDYPDRGWVAAQPVLFMEGAYA